MFEGTYQNSIDDKNRMIIPAKIRDGLGCTCVLTKGTDRCLDIYTLANWENVAVKLRALNTLDAKNRRIARHFFANASTCEIDKQGRVIIPQDLREYAGIEKDLLTFGVGAKIEVWSKAVWENEEDIDSGEVAQELAERGVNI